MIPPARLAWIALVCAATAGCRGRSEPAREAPSAIDAHATSTSQTQPAPETAPAPVRADAGPTEDIGIVAARAPGPSLAGTFSGTSETLDAPANLPGAPRRGARAPMTLTVQDDGGAEITLRIEHTGVGGIACSLRAIPHGVGATIRAGQTCARSTGDGGTSVTLTVESGSLLLRGDAVTMDVQSTVRMVSPSLAAVVYSQLDRFNGRRATR